MKKITIILLSFLFLLFSCNDKPDEKHYSIKVTDNTVLGINCSYQSIYPDTSLPILKPTMTVVSSNTSSEIKSQEWGPLYLTKNAANSSFGNTNWTETDANKRSARYLKRTVDFDWVVLIGADKYRKHNSNIKHPNFIDFSMWFGAGFCTFYK